MSLKSQLSEYQLDFIYHHLFVTSVNVHIDFQVIHHETRRYSQTYSQYLYHSDKLPFWESFSSVVSSALENIVYDPFYFKVVVPGVRRSVSHSLRNLQGKTVYKRFYPRQIVRPTYISILVRDTPYRTSGSLYV